jgi:flavin reductase (DIM6/NTAB) family NADH-FMN oxidoreductase RutF
MSTPRTPAERKRDTLARLATEVDAWVATSGPAGAVYLVPLSFFWDGATVTMATAEHTPTARNLRATGRTRLALGDTRDVVLVDGTVAAFSLETVPPALAEEFAVRLWDVRKEPRPYGYFRVTPSRIQAWRGVAEDAGRVLMRDGRWSM